MFINTIKSCLYIKQEVILTSATELITDRLPRRSSVLSFSMKHVGSLSKNTFSDSLFWKLTSKARSLRKAWQDLQEQEIFIEPFYLQQNSVLERWWWWWWSQECWFETAAALTSEVSFPLPSHWSPRVELHLRNTASFFQVCLDRPHMSLDQTRSSFDAFYSCYTLFWSLFILSHV